MKKYSHRGRNVIFFNEDEAYKPTAAEVQYARSWEATQATKKETEKPKFEVIPGKDP